MRRSMWLIRQTIWFIGASKDYMRGEKVTPFSAIGAYIRFIRLGWKDRVS